MSKKNNYTEQDYYENDDLGYYFMPPMYRCPYNEDMNQENEEPEGCCRQMPDQITPVAPTGFPTGSPIGGEPVLMNPNYTQAKLREFIGKFVRIEFLVGTGTFVDRSGILKEVGISYVILQEVETGALVFGDLYAIKFVTISPRVPVFTPQR